VVSTISYDLMGRLIYDPQRSQCSRSFQLREERTSPLPLGSGETNEMRAHRSSQREGVPHLEGAFTL
jgi:hypothetical protein